MTSSNAPVRSAGSGSTKSDHRFPWQWNLKDLQYVKGNGKKVFSCFSCGGGSSMGYKLAGYEMIGCCEIDPRMVKIYRQNLHPPLVYSLFFNLQLFNENIIFKTISYIIHCILYFISAFYTLQCIRLNSL